MKTLKHLKALAARHGVKLEEDTGYRDMRVFQFVAPDGMLFKSNDVQCEPLHWAKRGEAHAVAFNETAFKAIADTLSLGLRAMTREEIEEYEGETN